MERERGRVWEAKAPEGALGLRRNFFPLTALAVFAIGFAAVGYYQFTSDFLFAFDPYWFLGTAGVIRETSSAVFLTIPSPIAAEDTFVNIGYVPLQSLLLAALADMTGVDPIRSEQAFTAFLAGILMVLAYGVGRRLGRSRLAGGTAAVLLLCIPYVFQRWNFFVPENVSMAIFLAAALVLLSERHRPAAVAILLLGALAFHPRSFPFYAPLLALLWVQREGGLRRLGEIVPRLLDRPNRVPAVFAATASVPFLVPLWINVQHLLTRGATYTLAISTEGFAWSWEWLTDLLGPYAAILGVLGAASLVSRRRRLAWDEQFLLVWWLASWSLLLLGPLRNFPIHRFMLYLAVPSAFLGGVFAVRMAEVLPRNLRKRLRIPRRTLTLLVAAGVLAPAMVSLLASPLLTPWVAWGEDERAAAMYLRSLTEGRDDFVVFSPEFTLPYAYGVHRVEMREEVIARVLALVRSIPELQGELTGEYPRSPTFYVLLTNLSIVHFGTRFPILTMFEPRDAAFARPTVWIYVLPASGSGT